MKLTDRYTRYPAACLQHTLRPLDFYAPFRDAHGTIIRDDAGLLVRQRDPNGQLWANGMTEQRVGPRARS